jgi:glycerol-3-phosphate dehydrogenase
MLSRGAALRREPGLSRGGLRGGAVYSDAQVDDARLTLAVAQAAHETGATLVSRAAVTDFLHGPDGRIAGAVVEDTLGGARTEVRARLVLSATGPWTDEIRCLANPAAPPRLRPTKGVHIELPPGRLGNRGAIIFRSPVDGRVMFVLPWRDATYVGTTDTDFAGPPGEVAAGVGDVEYLIRSANALFPSARLTSADVVGTWAGVRPLLAPGSNVSAGQTSREHEIWREPGGLLCIAGGKLTTFRVMAVEAAERAASILRREHGVESGAFYSEHLPLPGAPADWEALRARIGREARALGITDASAEHLARAHGTAAEEILQRIRARPEIGAQILPPHPYLQAEVEHAVRREMAMTLDDVLRRRTRLFDEAADGGMTVAEEVALRMARTPELQWTPEQVAAQVAAYGERVQRARAALH